MLSQMRFEFIRAMHICVLSQNAPTKLLHEILSQPGVSRIFAQKLNQFVRRFVNGQFAVESIV
ncbi:hypothetical protein WT49_04265 [Burkholderia territorii]|nr:hypothetical protein WT00_16420 [Burkholderia territorii]KWE32525.1 hypothetical protein WT50_29605 [Burkholderia territorii]KWE42149.1 hypothetical protein WT49_04265 [Burkholderia territorii]KWE43818.1 hypothetical protein WT51_22660 [Burkholderia territorii]